MKKYAPGVDASDIRLVNVEESTRDAADPAADAVPAHAAAPVPESGDRYLRRATKEYTAGRIDRSLWARALEKAGGDEVRAKDIYLQSRATAIRVTRRDDKAARYAKVAEALGDGPETGAPGAVPKAAAKVPPKVSGSTPWSFNRVMLVTGVIGVVIIAGGLVAVLNGGGDSGQAGIAGPGAAGHGGAVGAKAQSAAASAAEESANAAARTAALEDFVGRIRALEKSGNWNLVVLYGVEWTRKQPDNPEAWKELSQGYIKLRQYGDALDAATKATQLAAGDFRSWQNLGQVYVALERPTDAISAFRRATSLNDQDVVSLVQEGKLSANLGRLADAKVAYAKALAASPDDAQALCGAASVANKDGPGKDAEAMMQRLTSRGELCVDPTAGVSVKAEPAATARKRTGP